MGKTPTKTPAKPASKKQAAAAKPAAETPAKAKPDTKAPTAKAPTAKAPATKAPAAKKQSGSTLSSIAGKVLGGAKATIKEVKKLAASVLGQDEKKGKKKD